ncbi:MAG: SURF1 family protein [Marinicellaceae bacterium]
MKKPPLIPSIVALFFVVLMTNLGLWQLQRAQEKEVLLELLADDQMTQVVEADQIKDLPQYANVTLSGRFLSSPQLLLDNQVNNKRIGFHVFTPFLIEGLNTYIMVNRGWVPKAGSENLDFDIESSQVDILGKLNHSPQVGIQLGEIELDNNESPQLMTYYDREKVSSFLYENLCGSLNCIVSNRVLLLEKDQSQGFERNWNPIVMLPEKHIGYAVQWFLMTLVLIIIFIYWVSKQED